MFFQSIWVGIVENYFYFEIQKQNSSLHRSNFSNCDFPVSQLMQNNATKFFIKKNLINVILKMLDGTGLQCDFFARKLY